MKWVANHIHLKKTRLKESRNETDLGLVVLFEGFAQDAQHVIQRSAGIGARFRRRHQPRRRRHEAQQVRPQPLAAAALVVRQALVLLDERKEPVGYG